MSAPITGLKVVELARAKEALEDQQIVHRGLQIDPEGVPGLRTPILFSRSKLSLTRAAPKRPFRL